MFYHVTYEGAIDLDALQVGNKDQYRKVCVLQAGARGSARAHTRAHARRVLSSDDRHDRQLRADAVAAAHLSPPAPPRRRRRRCHLPPLLARGGAPAEHGPRRRRGHRAPRRAPAAAPLHVRLHAAGAARRAAAAALRAAQRAAAGGGGRVAVPAVAQVEGGSEPGRAAAVPAGGVQEGDEGARQQVRTHAHTHTHTHARTHTLSLCRARTELWGARWRPPCGRTRAWLRCARRSSSARSRTAGSS